MVPWSLCGFSSALLAPSKAVGVRAVREHGVVQREAARHEAAAGLGVVDAVDQPHELDMTFMWYQGGRKVSSATIQRSGKTTKSMLAVPGVSRARSAR
jgi:hypothetical protein